MQNMKAFYQKERDQADSDAAEQMLRLHEAASDLSELKARTRRLAGVRRLKCACLIPDPGPALR